MFDIYEDDIIDNYGNKLDLAQLKQQMFDIENIMVDSDDSIFPDFLYQPMQNEFEGDNYIEQGIVVDELSMRVKQLRRKYGNYEKFVVAMGVYNEYKEALKEKYGSMKFARSGIKAGIFPEIYVVKPKIKMGKINRQLLGLEDPVSKIEPELEDYFEDAFESNAPTVSKDITYNDSFYDMEKPPKVLSEEFENQKRRARRRGLTLRYHGSAEIDAIVDFINNGGSIKYNERGDKVSDKYESLVAMAIEEDELSYRDSNILEIEEKESSPAIINGRVYKDNSENMIIDVMTELYKNGFDITGKGKSLGSQGKKMLRSNLNRYGLDETVAMSKKEKKKLKKRQKKHMKMLNREMKSDQRVQEIMAKNRVSFSFNNSDLDRLMGGRG